MIRDPGLLAAAIARPQASVFGEDAYPTLADKAAALAHSLVTSHPLLDGNKRVGLVAVRLFYALNAVTTRASQDEKVELIMAIADGTLRDVAKIAAVLRTWENRVDVGASGSPSDAVTVPSRILQLGASTVTATLVVDDLERHVSPVIP